MKDESAALAAKAVLISNYFNDKKALAPIRKLARDHYPEQESYIETLWALEREIRKAASAKNAANLVPFTQQIAELSSASLKDKRECLRTFAIVTVPVGASHLGVQEADLHRVKGICNGLIGARYASGQCYSIEELQLVAQNPKMMGEHELAGKQDAYELPPSYKLDHFIFVESQVAMAYANLTHSELSRVRKSCHRHRPYRLADLEHIRVQKIIQQLA